MPTEPALISIITPVYNGEAYLRECIDSVLAQNYAHIEHIIIDDGSTDNTCAIINEYPHIRLLQQHRAGATAARNAGLKIANGGYIKFLDADDVLAAGALARQMAASADLPPHQIGYGFAEEFSVGQHSSIHKRTAAGAYEHPLVDLIFRNVLTSLPLHPASALRDVAGFDERLRSGQEWNLHLKLASRGYCFVYQDIFIYRYRHHNLGERISNRKIDGKKELQNFEYSFTAIAHNLEPIVVDAWASYLWGFGRRALREGNPAGAALFFDKARQISPRGFRRFLQWRYCAALALLGAEKTEGLIAYTRRWRKKKTASRVLKVK